MALTKIFIIAGEPSGDILGADLMNALLPHDMTFIGIGGERMKEKGLSSLFPMEDLSVMGIFEILPRLFKLKKRIAETVAEIKKQQPDMIITIDSPGFTHRVLKKVRYLNIPTLHYVAPTVWAWKPKRAKKLAQLADHLLALLPFEPPYFEREGLKTTFVGHPIANIKPRADGFRARHKIPVNAQLLCVLPGSRTNEITRMLPIFVKTLQLLEKTQRSLHIVIPTFDHFAKRIESALFPIDIPFTVVTDPKEKKAAIDASNFALATSGTVALELSTAQVPCVIAYQMSPLTFSLIRRMIKVKYVSLPNLLLDDGFIPEFIQDDCQPQKLATAVNRLMDDVDARMTIKEKMRTAIEMLAPPAPFKSTGECVANAVLENLKTRVQK